jgi:hypothetical protein
MIVWAIILTSAIHRAERAAGPYNHVLRGQRLHPRLAHRLGLRREEPGAGLTFVAGIHLEALNTAVTATVVCIFGHVRWRWALS